MKLNFPRSPLALAALVLTGASAFAQPAVAPAPDAMSSAGVPDARPPMEPRGPRARPARAPLPAPPGRVEALVDTTVSGKVVRWLPNPNGEVDGLLLSDGTQVAFPPRRSARLVESVKLQDDVQILGRRGLNPKVVRATRIESAKSGQTIAMDSTDGDAPPTPPRPPVGREALTAMTASGRIATLLYTDRGDANGALLDDGAAVRFPPHVGEQIGAALKVGGTLYARGYGTRGAQGASFEATRIGTSESNARDVFPPRPPIDGAAVPGSPPPAAGVAPPDRVAPNTPVPNPR